MKTEILWLNVSVLVVCSMIITLTLAICGDESILDVILGSSLLGIVFGLCGLQLIETTKTNK